jgi:hypothetical protein
MLGENCGWSMEKSKKVTVSFVEWSRLVHQREIVSRLESRPFSR